jgi:FkbM family methyltransferase
MSDVIVDLAAKKQSSRAEPLLHPAGVTLPFDGPADAALIIPEIRSEVRSGTYCDDVLRLLPEAIAPGDRVLVIGAGLGVVSTLVARNEGVDRVIAVEANTALIPYLNRVHALNGVAEVEIVNAVLAEGKKGRVPFFARRDLRTSSLLPHDRSWQQVIMVPFMDLNLILTEERISLVICDVPVASARLLALAELGQVDCILLGCGDESEQCWEDDGICTLLVARGYSAERSGTAVLFHRDGAQTRRI